jgi:hypothetical protein
MKTIKKQYIYSSIQDSKVVFFEVILVVWRNSGALSEQTSVSSTFLNTTRLLKHVLKYEQHFSLYSTSWLIATRLAEAYSISKENE